MAALDIFRNLFGGRSAMAGASGVQAGGAVSRNAAIVGGLMIISVSPASN